MADRFYCPDLRGPGLVTLSGDEARHLATVRRLGPGDDIELFDGLGLTLSAKVLSISKARVELQAGDPIPERSALIQLTLATAIPKGERFDWLVEKATELGVARLVPLQTERSVVDPRPSKLDRLRRAVIEACKQCGRSRLMEIETPRRWDEFRHSAGSEFRFFAHPGGSPATSWPRPTRGASVTLAIGPEGGFTPEETDQAAHAGWLDVDLCPTILRVETAGVVGAALLLNLVPETRS